MATTRLLRPLLRTPLRLSSLARSRTYADSATSPILFSATATTTGGRATGHIQSQHLDIKLSPPAELGGSGAHANPEELFAAGYGACFQGAMSAVAGQLKIKLPTAPEANKLVATAHLVGDGKKLDFGIRVDMTVSLKGVKKEDAERIIERTKEVCPYSRATKGNVVTSVELEIL